MDVVVDGAQASGWPLLVLDLIGVFVSGLSGGPAAVRQVGERCATS